MIFSDDAAITTTKNDSKHISDKYLNTLNKFSKKTIKETQKCVLENTDPFKVKNEEVRKLYELSLLDKSLQEAIMNFVF